MYVQVSHGLGQTTYSDKPSTLVYWWRKLTGYTEPLPVTPRYELMTQPRAPLTAYAMQYWTPEMMQEAQAQGLDVSAQYEDYLRQRALAEGDLEAAAPGEEVAVPSGPDLTLPWVLILVGGGFLALAVMRR